MQKRPIPNRSRAALLLGLSVVTAAVLALGAPAGAAIVATVNVGTAAADAVLAGTTVTNTGATVLNGSLGLSPGTSVTGFPPGQVVPPGTIDVNNAVAAQAQSDLTAAYVDAAGRPVDATTTADLGNLNLGPGVYAGPSKGALGLTGNLTLDAAGNNNAVFIFQTNSTLITASSSTVSLVNGAQECNVFWQVGSSATLGTGSTFRGTILALTSVTVTNNVAVHGRALARNGAVTLDLDTFTRPTCAAAAATTTTAPTTTSTTAVTTTTTAVPSSTTTAVPSVGTPAPGSSGQGGPGATPTGAGAGGPVRTPELPRTGAPIGWIVVLGVFVLGVGNVALGLGRLHRRT